MTTTIINLLEEIRKNTQDILLRVNKEEDEEVELESAVSSVTDLIESRRMISKNNFIDYKEDEREEANEEYRDLLNEWEESDFSDDLVPEIFLCICEWVERYETCFEVGSQMRRIIKTFKRRIQNDDCKKSIVSDFLIGIPSETFCKTFGIVDGGCESLEALLLRESAVVLKPRR